MSYERILYEFCGMGEHYPLLDIECFIPKPNQINELVNRIETELLR